MVEIIPLWLVNALSFATVFSVMTSIGTTITPALFLAHIRSPGLLLRGLLCVLAIVPAAGFAAGFAFGLAPGEKVGVALMAIAPGAPLALRRALGSGGDAGFSPTLQIMVALLAIVAMPAWVAVGNALLGTNGFVNVAAVAKQVGIAQLLPLGVGALMAAFAPARAVRIGALLGKIGAVLLIGMVLGQLLDMHRLIYFHQKKVPEGFRPSTYGYSRAHWEGQTLVIETSALHAINPVGPLQRSDKAHVTERWRIVQDATYGRALSIDVVEEDPLVFQHAAPGHQLLIPAAPGSALNEYGCSQSLWEDHIKTVKPLDASNPSGSGTVMR